MKKAKLCKDCGLPGKKGNPLAKDGMHVDWVACIQTLKARCAKLEADVAEHDHSFELRWKADMRAIERWQAAHPGNELVWPDHADLVVWLLGQLEEKQ